MPLISTSIANLINGVSQQPEALRLPSQCESQVNYLPSVVEGLRKRPPTSHVAQIQSGTLAAATIHTINRDVSERYVVVITNGDLKVYDIDGTEQTVAFPNGKGYLTATSANTAFRATTIADFTFVVNTEMQTAMSSTIPTGRGVEAIVFVQQANFSTDYNITVDGYTATVSTGASGALSTSTIVADLKTDLDANLTGFTTVQNGPVLHIYRNDSANFDVSIEDSRSNTQMSVAKDTVQRFSDLPTLAPTGFTVEIVGDQSSNFDNYYVSFVPYNDGATFDQGIWEETVRPGIAVDFDNTTMPHVLVRESDGTFTFRQQTWGARTVGDEDSAPDPSFVGRAINDLFFYKSRLGFLSDENVIMSESNSFFNFFPTTVTTIVDSDPVDVSASHVKVSILRHAVPFNERLLLFSDQTQFQIEDQDILASAPPGVQVLTEFESSLRAKPVGAGRTVFFATNKGQFSGLREYFILPDTQTTDAADITAHVPKYVPANVFKLAVASNEDILFAVSSDQPNRLYTYKYYWAGNEKLQSAWSYWEFTAGVTVLNVDFIDTDAYVLLQYPDGVYLERLPVEPGRADTDALFEYHLDRKLDETQCTSISYDSVADTTTFTLPYNVAGTVQVVTRHDGNPHVGTLPPGVVLQTVSTGTNTITVRGRHDSRKLFIGVQYTARYRFSQQVVKEQALGGGQSIVGEGRLQILFWSIVYDETGYFRAEVTPDSRPTKTYVFTGRILGADTAILGEVPIESGSFKYPVFSKNDRVTIELVNDTYLPSRFLSAEWEGRRNIRSRRV